MKKREEKINKEIDEDINYIIKMKEEEEERKKGKKLPRLGFRKKK